MPASRSSWKCEPFKGGVPLPYQVTFTGVQFDRLKQGLIPERMEDKWFIFYEEPHLFLHRSWSGEPVYRLTLKTLQNGAEVKETLLSRYLAINSKQPGDYEVQLLDFLVSNLLLGQAKPFPLPHGAKESVPGILQHHVSGTGYAESPLTPKKPWWRIW